MKRLIASGLLAALLVAGVQAQEVHSLNVVGFQKLDIVGGASATYSLLSVPMTKIPVYRGTVTANTTNTITDANASWTPGQFAEGVVGQEATGSSTFFVEITSSNNAFEGYHAYILTNSATMLTLKGTMGNAIAGDLVNANYKIVPGNRVRDLFGETNAPTLTGGSGANDSDSIQTWTPGLGWSSSIYFKKTGAPSSLRNHWVQGSAIADNRIVDRDEGILVKRLAGGSTTNILVAGEVSANSQVIPLEPGYELIGGMSAINQPIVQTGLTNIMKGGSGANDSDTIQSWTPGVGWSSSVYFKKTGAPSSLRNHWVQGSVNVDNTFIFEAGKGYLFKMSSTQQWERYSPLQ